MCVKDPIGQREEVSIYIRFHNKRSNKTYRKSTKEKTL